MNYNVNHYRHLLPIIKNYIEMKKDRKPEELISELAITTSCPVLVICYLYIDLGYDSATLNKTINNLKTFYKATVTDGKE